MKRLATTAILALAATAALAVPATAKSGTAKEHMVVSAPPPAGQLSLSKSVLSNDSPYAKTDHLVQVADARTRKRRIRMTNPRRTVTKRRVAKPRFKTTARNNGTNAPAPLDCSIESHPDCPRPTSGHIGMSQYQYSYEGYYQNGDYD